jgi:Ca2+/Na+ antiporter
MEEMYTSVPMQEMYQLPPEEVDHFGKPIPELQGSHVIETDYRLFRYSKFALPWLLFLFGCSVVLFCLTLWQGGFGALKTIYDGIPRDLEPWKNDPRGDGGLSRSTRNLRFAEAIIAACSCILVIIIYYANPRPKIQRLAYYVCAFFLVAAVVLAIIAFCIDVSRTGDCRKCKTDPGTMTISCENKAAYAVVCTVCDATIAIIGVLTIIMLVLWTKDETFRNSHMGERNRDLAYDNTYPEEAGMQMAVPGVRTVHQALIFYAMIVLIIAGVMQLLFSIFIHEFRERVTGSAWDPINNQSQAGWSRPHSRFRLATTIIAILLCLLSFVPYPKRVYVYMLAWLFLACAVMHFVIFAMDIKDLGDAKNLNCPSKVSCTFDQYNTTAAFDIMNGLFIVIYVVYEFVIKHGQSTVTTQRLVAFAEEEVQPENEPLKDVQPAIEGPYMRPLLGIEVIEVQGPNGELHVTVMNVTPGGAAEEAQVRPGDVVQYWDEMPIHCKADFAQAVSGARIGSTVMLQVSRQTRVGPAATATSAVYCKLVVRGVPA